MDGKELAGGGLFLEGQKTRNAAVIGPAILDARFAWRRRGFGHAGNLIAALNVGSILRPDFFCARVVGNQDTGHLARMVLLMMQRTTRAASLEFLSSLQECYRLMASMDLPAADITLVAGQNKPTISEVTPPPDGSQKQKPNEYIPDLHWLTPIAMSLTSPYHFQMA